LSGRVIRPGNGGFDAVFEHFEGDDDAGGTVWIFTQDEDFGFGVGFGVGFGGGSGFGSGGSGVEFAELFEETEGALEGAFGGGSVAKQEVVFFDVGGGPIGGREAFLRAFMAVQVALSAHAVPLGLGGFEDEIM
jgi:hypothetical protein